MKPPRFRYLAADSVEEAVGHLAAHGPEARVLAGGQSLMPLLNRRLVRPSVIIDISRARDLAYIDLADELRLGAGVTQMALERSTPVRRTVPLLAQALAWVGSVATKNRGTVGGSAAFADPAAEIPAALLALDARLIATNSSGSRELGASEFVTGPFRTALEPDELVTEIRVAPDLPGTRTRFIEVSRRPGGSRAIVGVALAARLDDDRTCRSIRIALSGVGEAPIRARGAERLLIGATIRSGLVREAARAVNDDMDPPADALASRATRRSLAVALVHKGLIAATNAI
ncbi:MAG TPA: FAD binding domain-containing protein [Solirubrobacteraceae bacterium]|nr:FAD binding domain-containing protein [Solirubrobacteraceae bacterium]